MDISKRKPARRERPPALIVHGEKTCIDCHKGIAHRLPKGAYDFGLAHDVPQSGELKALLTYVEEQKK